MHYSLLAAFLLLTAGINPLFAQSGPAKPAAVQYAATSPEAHLRQYFTDLTQRTRDVYFAPSDGRAIALLSTGRDEFGARKRALLAELARLPQAEQQRLAEVVRQGPWAQEIAGIKSTAAAAKMADRIGRNPALESAFRRFEEAGLNELLPDSAGQ